MEDILLNHSGDRRALPHVPDLKQGRKGSDRRGAGATFTTRQPLVGVRYCCRYDVEVSCKKRGTKTQSFRLKSIDISDAGMLLQCQTKEQLDKIQGCDDLRLKFTITAGSMPEGYEARVRIGAKVARTIGGEASSQLACGLAFTKTLSGHIHRQRGRIVWWLSVLALISVALFIMMMRAENVLYFRANWPLHLYSILTAVFLLSRYLFGMLCRPIPVNPEYTPGVSIIIPCFNEEKWIERTIVSCMDQNYPPDKLELIVVDDCSSDRSATRIRKTIETLCHNNNCSDIKNRVSYHVMEKNSGKRGALSRGIIHAKHELVVFVDSDSFLEPSAIRHLVQPFQDPKMGGVAGRTDVANVYTNWLTKMQATRYYISFRIMKAAESYFDTVTCLSGPLACYRKSIVMENLSFWNSQKFLGRKATFGDDRSLTNLVLRHHRTGYQDTAVCRTVVPNQQRIFLRQQMRWKRSWLRESVIAGSFIWKKEPLAALFFYIGFIAPFLAPVVVFRNLIYTPLVHQVFPANFLFGILMLTLLMSFFYLLFRRSNIWLYSALFCLYYEAILLWQMPIAWVTFWKSTWGTRKVPEDVKATRGRVHEEVGEAVAK